jgi:hypothetical protein
MLCNVTYGLCLGRIRRKNLRKVKSATAVKILMDIGWEGVGWVRPARSKEGGRLFLTRC